MGPSHLGVLVCPYEVAFCHIDGFWEVIVHRAGCEYWLGGEETCVNGLAPCIDDKTETGPVGEMYKGSECVNMVSAIGETI